MMKIEGQILDGLIFDVSILLYNSMRISPAVIVNKARLVVN